MLQIRLLGQFDVRLDGKRVTIPTRAGQSLFAYLTLTAGTPHRREKLAGIFWPETTEESARKNLRQELWRIRKSLMMQKTGTEEYLLSDDLTITFDRNTEYWLDIAQLEKSDLDLESLNANLSLYQGELLPGFYDDWILLERERIQSLFETRMEQLVELLVEAERWIAVQEQSERWLALSSAPEAAYRALMLSYNARGDMARVSKIYQRCIDDLQDQFGVEPSAETHALYNGLLKGARAPRRILPTQSVGTVTFLFTDIEESTNLLDKLKDQYASVLEEHHRIMRDAIRKWNGQEVDTQGDAFFVTFSRALDAVQCAADAQRAFSSHQWLQDQPLRVRMGLHTGEPLIASTGYIGMDVHRAARIGDAAHGGQVLLSQTTRELIANDLPDGVAIRDLGEHRLKDLKFPTFIYQLDVEGLASDFPPIRTRFSGTEAPTPGEPPFKGLQFFDEADAYLFFGRELLTAKLVDRLRETQYLSVIIGASGSGKSSLVRAGLIPALRSGKELMDGFRPPAGSSDWQVHILTPSANPIKALAVELTRDSESLTAASTLMDDLMQDPRSLALHLARRDGKQHTLLVLDQFEELFTLCRDEFEREAFIDNLLYAISTSPGEDKVEGRITLILTLRADFYAHLAQYPELREAVARQQEYIGPMTTEELRRAIEEPARRAHWDFEPGLVDLILRDVGDEPGALPLLSHALLETWKRRTGHTLTLKGYADAGGVRGAIAHTAETVFQRLSPEEQAIARNIFLRLTELGEGTEDTRRRVSFDELFSNAQDESETREVLNILAEARLVTLGENTAEVAHEALIREWPTLREWLNQDREGLQLHRRLTETTREWELLEHDDGVLYRGAQLAQAREWAALHPRALNANEQAFLDASIAFERNKIAEREAQQRRELEAAQKLAETERQAGVRLRLRNRVISAVGVIAVILAGIAFAFSRQSNSNAITAEENARSALNAQATAQANAEVAQQIQAQAETDERLATSRELAAASLNSLDEDPERSVILALESISTTRDVDGTVLRESLEALHSAIVSSPVRKTLVHGGSELQTVTYSPDGKQLAAVGESGTVVIWDSETGQEIHRFVVANEDDGWRSGSLLAYRPDGSWLVSFDKNLVAIYDPASGKIIKTLEGHIDNVTAVAFSRDGKHLATGAKDGSIIIWDGFTGEILSQPLEYGESIEDLTFSPDGNWLITAADDFAIKVWDVRTGGLLHELPISSAFVANLRFSPDGDRFMYADLPSGESYIWQIGSQAKDDPSQLLSGEYLTLPDSLTMAFSPDGNKVVGTYPGGLKIWDANTGAELWKANGLANSISFSLDGKSLASADNIGRVRIWSTLPGNERNAWEITGNFIDLQPAGNKLITVNPDNSGATVWNRDSGKPQFTVQDEEFRTIRLAVSPDGARFATGEDFGGTKIWDMDTGEQLLSFMGNQEDMREIAFSPDGMRLVTAGIDKKVRLWDSTTGEMLFEDEFPNFVTGAAFSPDNAHFAASTFQGLIKVWDKKTGDLALSLSSDTPPDFAKIAYSPDGTMLAAYKRGGHISLLDAITGDEIRTLEGSGLVRNPVFSPDGRYLAVADALAATIWDLDSDSIFIAIPVSGGVKDLEFSQAGDRLYVIDEADSVVREYLLDTDELLALAQSRVTRSLTETECQKYLHLEQCP